jgi:UDP-glucose 4-epimerase
MPNESAIVTGGAGFIGSHVVDALLADGKRVVAVDDLSFGDAARVADEADLEELDIVDGDAVKRTVGAAAPSAIYHLAAQSSVTVSVDDPARDCAVNVQGTMNVLEAAKQRSTPVIFASTGGALYGNDAPLPTSEDRLPSPLAPYGASKWAGEAYLVTWANATGTPHAICRLGNVYGPRQSPHGEAGVVAIFSHKLFSGQTPVLFGHGKPTRDYVHVDDVVRGMLAATGTPGIFNIATGTETDVQVIFDHLQREAGTSIEPEFAPLRPGELERSSLDPRRAERELGWRAEVKLPEGLSSTYRALVEGFEREAA